MSEFQPAAAGYLAAVPRLRSDLKTLEGGHARRALVQVLAEYIVQGAAFEAEAPTATRLADVEAQLQAAVRDLQHRPEGCLLSRLLASRMLQSTPDTR